MAQNRMVYVTGDGQLMKMNLLDRPEDAGMISYLHEPFHIREITCIATCLKKPYLMTTGIDKTLRLYQYNTGQLRLKLCEKLDEYIISMDIHPSGMYMVACTEHGLVYYTICEKEFCLTHRTPLNQCRVIKFSHGGHVFAVGE